MNRVTGRDVDLPIDVLDNIASLAKARKGPDLWKWTPLTTTNPAFRVNIDGDRWIVKRSRDDRKDEILSLLFDEYGIAHHKATCLGERWILMCDAGAHTLESMPRECYDITLFSQLGRLAAAALLVGMRDRKLGNIAVDVSSGEGLVLSHIDYEGAFRSGLVNRILRPDRYYRYLLMRLLFDVVRHCEERDVQAAFSLFLEAFCKEWHRLLQQRPSTNLRKKMWLRERLMLCSGRRSVTRARALMERAFHISNCQTGSGAN